LRRANIICRGTCPWHQSRAAARTPRRFHRAASHEVLVPSALTGRDALSGAAGLRTIPLRRFFALLRARASADPRSLGVALAVFRLADASAVKLDARTIRRLLFAQFYAAWTRRLNVLASRHRLLADRAGISRGNRLDRAHVRPVASSATAWSFAVRARSFTSAFVHVAFRYRARTIAAWPGRAILPSVLARRRSWGSSALRRFAPAAGWPPVFRRPGPRAHSSNSLDPIDFRRADFAALAYETCVRNMRA